MSTPGAPRASTTRRSGSAARIHLLQVVGNAIVGGMESWVERLITHLPPDRFLCTVLCPFESPFTERLRGRGTEVLIAPMADDPAWSTVQMAAAIASNRGIDLIHAHLPRAHVLAGLVGRLTDKPVLYTLHGRQLGTLDLEVHRACGSHLSVVCQPSYFQALGLGVDPEQLSLEPNGVDTQWFKPQLRQGASVRAALGLDAQAPLVGFVGRLSPEKGPEVFVRSALLWLHEMPGAHAVLVGEGPMEHDLRAQISLLGLQGRVHLAGLRHDMPAVYADLDAVVSSSHSEAMPLALMEAMACGVATVATAVGGVPDIVVHGQTGWLVAPAQADEIANRCLALLRDPAARLAMGERARQRAEQRLSLDDSVKRVAQLVTRLAQRAPQPVDQPLPEPRVANAAAALARPQRVQTAARVTAAPAASAEPAARHANGHAGLSE